MVEKVDRLEESWAKYPTNMADILLALSLLRENLAAKKVLTVDYPFDDFGVNSYLPFMNFLQSGDFESVRRFLLIHPSSVAGGQWDTAGNGVHTSISQLTLD
jgi:hypothetical protein